MKHFLIPAIIMALCLVPITSKAQHFSAVNDDGVTIYYNIISESEKTCEVTSEYPFSGGYKGDLVIPEEANGYKVIAFGWSALYSCSDLISITIPKSIKSTEELSFFGCKNLQKVIIEDITSWCNIIFCDDMFSNPLYYAHDLYSDVNTRITQLIIPKAVTKINNRTFMYCTGLTSVTIPKTVTSIGNSAFANCSNLSTVYSEITDFFDIPPTVFSGSENATLYVPKGMVTTYRSSTGWSVIKNIEEMPDNTPDLPFLISCSGKGSVSINGLPSIIKKIATANINEGSNNTFTFTPNPGCKLDNVILNGLDITANIVNNTLTCTIPAKSQMIVTFSSEQGDINNDGRIDISDVVSIVNKILSH